MKLRATKSLLSTILLLCFGGANFDQDVPRPQEEPIYEGFAVKLPSQFPWHAGLYTKTTRPYKQICGCTIVAKHVVITAAHCLSQDRYSPPPSEYAVAAGKIYRPWNDPDDAIGQKSEIKEIIFPPRYQGAVANFQDDIAVLILANEFVYNVDVRQACVNFNTDFDEAQLKEGQFGKVAGWGLTGENSESSQVLQATMLPTVAIDKCIEQSPVNFRSSITGDKICAGYNNGSAVCRGDSGGGLVFFANWRGIRLAFLRGVVSTAPTSENKCNIYTWATFTHVLKHEHFLKSVVPDIEYSCELPPNDDIVQYNFCEINNSFGNRCCSCECTKTYYEVEHNDKIFSLNL